VADSNLHDPGSGLLCAPDNFLLSSAKYLVANDVAKRRQCLL